jgi:cyclophilin family peptidyl-prolyl cis-trans isomerase
MAMLDALEALGPVTDAETVGALGARLADFDPLIAARAAAILGAWTGTTVKASPRPLPRPPLTMKDVPDVRLRVSMAGGGTFTMRLFVDEAPLTVHRILTGAKQGYYDGLTFHRVVPNFVIQGGSPGANEYVGDGPFMRDEVGLVSHTRGTVGISTRGRDTGDAQIFVNLVDLARLDHIYTAFAEVVDGMAVVDGILEGDVIARVDVVGPR